MILSGTLPAMPPVVQRGLLAILLMAALAGCSPMRTVESVRLLRDMTATGSDRVAEALAQRVEIAYEVEQRARRADLYLPPGKAVAALVLVPGATEEGYQDPRLLRVADAFRRAGFLVLIPALADDDPLRFSAADALAIADAIRYLSKAADAPQVGLAAISYAVGPTIMAALYDDTRPKVGFIVAISGYQDIVAGITYITTGAFREAPGEPWRYAEVNPRVKWLFLRAHAGLIEDEDDACLLELVALSRLEKPERDVSDLVGRLGDQGCAAYELFVNEDPDRVPELIAALPASIREEIAALDLARRDLSTLEADLILLHGRRDPVVPYTESVRLARAVPPDRAVIFLVDGLRHVDFAGGGGPDDAFTFLRAAYRVLTERDAAPRPTVPARPLPTD